MIRGSDKHKLLPDEEFSGIVSLITICSTVVLPAGMDDAVCVWEGEGSEVDS